MKVARRSIKWIILNLPISLLRHENIITDCEARPSRRPPSSSKWSAEVEQTKGEDILELERKTGGKQTEEKKRE